MKIKAFYKRNLKELMRESLIYIFTNSRDAPDYI